MQLTAETDDGNTYTATQENTLALNQWHQVAGSFTNNVLTLAVGNERIETAVTGQLSYTTASLNVGQSYSGLMNSLKWFNLASDPLTTFADGSETQSVMLGGTGQATITINSTGKMLSFNSQLPMQSIAVQADDTRQTIELLSTATFEQLAGASLSAGLVAGTPDFNLAALEPTSTSAIAHNTPASLLQSEALFPKAHAYNVEFMDVVGIAASLIGLDSLQVIWNQIGNMLSGKEVDIVAFSVALLDVLSLFPPAAPLKAVTIPAKTAIKLLKLGNNNAVRYLGGVMKKMFQQAKGRDFSLVFQGIAFFIVMADMALDEEAREGITEIAKMINSTDDFLDLLEYFSLADDEIALPDTSTASIGSVSAFEQFATAEYGVFPQAQASITGGTGRLLGKVLAELAPVLARSGKDAPKALGSVGEILKSSNNSAVLKLRKQAFKSEFIESILGVVKKSGLQKLRNFLLGYNGQRISPLAMVAITAYLEKEESAGRLFDINAPLYEHNVDNLGQLYFKAMPAAFTDTGIAQGASYHLMMLALLHASSQNTLAVTGYEVGKIIGIEVPRYIPIYTLAEDADDGKDGKTFTRFERKIDIVTGELYRAEKWWEAKSFRSVSKTNKTPKNKMQTFNWGISEKAEEVGRDGQPHKQFVLDRIAMKLGALATRAETRSLGLERDTPPWIVVNDYYWLFHKFVAGVNKDIINPSLASLTDRDKNGKGLLKEPSNMKAGIYPAHVDQNDGASGRINLGAIKTLLDILKEHGSEIAVEAIEELNDDQG